MICNICEKESVCKLIDGSDVVKCAEFLSINPNDYIKDAGMTREEAISIMKVIVHMLEEKYDTDRVEDAVDMAIKALEQEPCEDCISREEVCDYIAEFVNHEYATDREREMVKHIIGGIQHLPSIQPTVKENLVVEDCISRAELLKAIDTWDKFGVDDTNSLFRLDNLSLPHYVPYIHYDDVVKAIKGMPSVQPKSMQVV